MTDNEFMAELAGIEAESGAKLDDGSIGFLARLRDAGVLSDEEWEQIKGFLRNALRYLARSRETEERHRGAATVSLDADPRNEDWIRIVRAKRLAGHKLPHWAALWLWRLRTDLSAAFWNDVGEVARQMGFEPVSERPRQ